MGALRCAAAGSHFYGALALVFRAHHSRSHVVSDTMALYVGAALSGLVSGALAVGLHLRDTNAAAALRGQVRKAIELNPEANPSTLQAALLLDFESVGQARPGLAGQNDACLDGETEMLRMRPQEAA